MINRSVVNCVPVQRVRTRRPLRRFSIARLATCGLSGMLLMTSPAYAAEPPLPVPGESQVGLFFDVGPNGRIFMQRMAGRTGNHLQFYCELKSAGLAPNNVSPGGFSVVNGRVNTFSFGFNSSYPQGGVLPGETVPVGGLPDDVARKIGQLVADKTGRLTVVDHPFSNRGLLQDCGFDGMRYPLKVLPPEGLAPG